MKKRKKTVALFIFIILIGCFFVGLFLHMLNNPLSHEYYIFQNISECEQLIPSDQSNAKIEIYNNVSNDKDLKDLSYKDFFSMNYQSDTLEYELFAYEFEDSDSALKYYVNATGQRIYEKKLPLESEDENNLLYASKGMSYYRIVVIHKNTAYQLIAPNRYQKEVNELLASSFSIKMP